MNILCFCLAKVNADYAVKVPEKLKEKLNRTLNRVDSET